MLHKVPSPYRQFCLLTFCAAVAFGQAERATVTGTVADSSGSIVVNADLSIKNVATNITTRTKTNSAGIYYLPALPPGRYAEMLRRRPDLPVHMVGGPANPLGARAIYLGSSLYRIHGSNEPQTIGTAVSSGCFRMRNEDVIDLYERVKIGTKVVVI